MKKALIKIGPFSLCSFLLKCYLLNKKRGIFMMKKIVCFSAFLVFIPTQSAELNPRKRTFASLSQEDQQAALAVAQDYADNPFVLPQHNLSDIVAPAAKRRALVGAAPDNQVIDLTVTSPNENIQEIPRAASPMQQSMAAAPHIFVETLFSPRDNIKDHLVKLIHSELKGILVTSYTFTDEDIAQALIEASRRGVNVEVIVDGEQTCKFFNMWKIVRRIANNRISVWTYARARGIMHDKFIIFQDNVYRTFSSLLWTGSFNLTQKANKNNRENVVIANGAEVTNAFQNEFTTLKRQSDQEIPPLSFVSCPQCNEDRLKAINGAIKCTNCGFTHPYIYQ